MGRLDGHWGSNPKHLLKSLARMQTYKADLIISGHGYPISGAENVATSLKNRVQRVEQLLAIPGLQSMMPLDLSD